MKPALLSFAIALLLIAFTPVGRLEAKSPNILFCMAESCSAWRTTGVGHMPGFMAIR